MTLRHSVDDACQLKETGTQLEQRFCFGLILTVLRSESTNNSYISLISPRDIHMTMPRDTQSVQSKVGYSSFTRNHVALRSPLRIVKTPCKMLVFRRWSALCCKVKGSNYKHRWIEQQVQFSASPEQFLCSHVVFVVHCLHTFIHAFSWSISVDD